MTDCSRQESRDQLWSSNCDFIAHKLGKFESKCTSGKRDLGQRESRCRLSTRQDGISVGTDTVFDSLANAKRVRNTASGAGSIGTHTNNQGGTPYQLHHVA